MNYYSYIVARDYGFAPNPFGEHCTLATCKPRIRKGAQVDDWIFGLSSKSFRHRLVFAMKVSQKITFNEYWKSPEFQYKKPILNGSLKQMYGDNIYYFDEKNKKWHQENSHHSLDNGEINKLNLNRDTKGKYVLIANDFFYFGRDMIEIPKGIKDELVIGIGFKKINEEKAKELINFLNANYHHGIYGEPVSFEDFVRYDGK